MSRTIDGIPALETIAVGLFRSRVVRAPASHDDQPCTGARRNGLKALQRTICTLGLSVLVVSHVAATAQTVWTAASKEAFFDAQLSADDQLIWLKQLSSAPNHVGSTHDRANAEFILHRFQAWGWTAHIETFQVLVPTPIKTVVELVSRPKKRLGGQEPPVPGDESSNRLRTALPPYVAYQGDGDVTADVVYVNYGMPEDYEALSRRGVSVNGRIVLARYGGGWRGLKPKLAQEHGAAGCLIYSDPADDGYRRGEVYPVGGWRPSHSVQRGSVADMTAYPGDPLTPGVGATEDAKRLRREDAPTILRIPVLPISYSDAVLVITRLRGVDAPQSWQGGLPLFYRIGGDGSVLMHLVVRSDWSLKPVYDVIAELQGDSHPDQWVLRGNHHDAWVFGATDPLSGTVAMLSEAKALGAMWKAGWRPARSIVYASWDGEEPSLLGSTEWGETHASELQAKAVVYINTDLNGRGFLFAGGDQSFQHLLNVVAGNVIDPETGSTVADRWRAGALVTGLEKSGPFGPAAVAAAQAKGSLPLASLGAGSDFTVFAQHLGIPSMNLYYGGEDAAGGVYHSAYDSFHHADTFVDPGRRYGVLLSQTVGRIVIRIADALEPVQRFADMASSVASGLAEIDKLVLERKAGDAARERMTTGDAFRLATDPARHIAPPAAVTPTPTFDFTLLQVAVGRLSRAANALDEAVVQHGPSMDTAHRTALDAQLRDIDQLLLNEAGLPGRPWYRHLLHAPGRFTGYEAKTLPGIREAIEERRFDDAEVYITRTAKALNDYAARLEEALSTIRN